MPGLTIGGVTVPVLARNAKRQPVKVEDWDKAFDGTPRGVIRSLKQSWQLQLVPKAQSLVAAFEHLIKGDGHAWSFDSDMYSAVGLGPNAGHSATIVGSGKYGNRLHVPTGTSITFAANLGSNWTVVVWRLEDSAWDHYVITSAGHKWENGFRQDGLSTTWLSVSGGSLTISGTTVSTVVKEDFDDLRALPYVVDDSWPAQIYAEDSARAASALPVISAGGNLITSGPISARGRVNDVEVIRSGSGILESPSFVLLES
jgi:hypothetical protein